MSNDLDDEVIASIAPDVLAVLTKRRFFDKLDDLLCPADTLSPEKCTRNYKLAEAILISCGFDEGVRGEIFAVLRSVGGCCDCEILYNVAESSRLKAKYWEKRAHEIDSDERPHSTLGCAILK